MAKTKFDPYKKITDAIVAKLEEGVAPWRKPWSGGALGAPKNLRSKKPYQGINVWLLAMSGYDSPWWMTYKQAIDFGGNVRKGETGTKIIFWRQITKAVETDDEKDSSFWMLKVFTVFNSEQCELPEGRVPVVEVVDNGLTPIESAAAIVAAYTGPAYSEASNGAWYRPSTDTVNVPPLRRFEAAEEYYSTMFHEQAHSTGHKSRLDRLQGDAIFGSHAYSAEELVAEMTAAFLCGHAGSEDKTPDTSAAYLASWIKRLKKDPKLIIRAASQAQKAATLILKDLVVEEAEDVAEAA